MKTNYITLIMLIGLIYGGCSNDEVDLFQRLAAQMASDDAKKRIYDKVFIREAQNI